MKTLKELGISPAPWVQGKICKDMIHTSDLYHIIATTDTSGIDYVKDARLISAAPELYEALREMYECVNELQEYHCKSQHTDGDKTCEDCKYNVAWLEKARAALEKAGGAE